jgi:murein DD-endopeptidase MepM/ murein hydrolase activator NlpD
VPLEMPAKREFAGRLPAVLALLLALALTRAPLPTAPATPDWSSWPARGAITTPFGPEHPGIDIGILRSLAVRAAQPGTVVAVGQPRGFEGYGQVVEIADGRGFTSLYAHLAGWRVRVGQQVWPGERIGTAGCTGWCTGTHLHFEMRHFSRPVNPLDFRD